MFEYGHWEWDPYGGYPYWVSEGYVRHYAYYADSGEYYGIKDYAMYPHGGPKNYFTMIWTCTTADLFYDTSNPPDGVGDEYGYWDTAHGTGKVGMPYAWTQTTSLDQNGYVNPVNSNYCYIGFENISKMVIDPFESSGTYNYGDWIRKFYYYAVTMEYSINDALDAATNDMGVGMSTFDATGNDLYHGWQEEKFGVSWNCLMRVYGDGDNVLGG
jgi:hypothetical protein